MESLPLELKIQVALQLPLDDLTRLCQTSPSFSVICQDESFWLNRTRIDFPDSLPYRPQTISWRDYYHSMARPRTIPVYDRGDIVTFTLAFSDYNPMFSLPEIKKILKQREIAVFYDHDFHPIAYLNEKGQFIILYDALPEVTGVVIADKGLPLTQEAIYGQRLSPESPFPFLRIRER